MRTDRELISDYLAGDEEAFRTFYELHRRQLYVYLLSLVRARDVAEELLQETFFAFLRNVEVLDRRANFGPYLFRTARNRAIDHLRRERRAARALERRGADPLFQRQFDSRGESWVDVEEVESLLFGLPIEQREAVVLRTIGELTFQEIARLTGVPENTAVSRCRYAIEKLRDRLETGGRRESRR